MKKIFIATLLLLTAIATMSAANEADALIKKAAAAFCNKGVEVSYTLDMDGNILSGKLSMDGQKFFIDAEEMLTWFDGKTQWTMQVDDDYSEVYISEPTADELKSINPYLLLNHYEKGYTASLGSKNKGLQEVVLTAKDQTDIKAVTVWMKPDGYVDAMRVVLAQGQEMNIKVNSFRNGLSLSKSTFTIPSAKLKKAAEVVDMR